MNKSLLVGVVFGAGIATAFGGFAGYRMLSGAEYAQVVSVTPVTESVRTPRQECSDQVVTRQEPVKDTHKIAGYCHWRCSGWKAWQCDRRWRKKYGG